MLAFEREHLPIIFFVDLIDQSFDLLGVCMIAHNRPTVLAKLSCSCVQCVLITTGDVYCCAKISQRSCATFIEWVTLVIVL